MKEIVEILLEKFLIKKKPVTFIAYIGKQTVCGIVFYDFFEIEHTFLNLKHACST